MSTAKKIVVDACVARAAGEKSQFPLSVDCRKFLKYLFEATNHKLVMSPDLIKEWDKHQSNFSLQVRTALARKGRIHYIQKTTIPNLRATIQKIKDQGRVNAILKDIHLIESALYSDQTVVSNDEKVRNHLKSVCDVVKYNNVHILPLITWVNPTIDNENVISWLLAGAQAAPAKAICCKNQDSPIFSDEETIEQIQS